MVGVEVLNSDSTAFLRAFDVLCFYTIPTSMRSHSNSPFQRYHPLMRTSRHTLACDSIRLHLWEICVCGLWAFSDQGDRLPGIRSIPARRSDGLFRVKQGSMSFISFRFGSSSAARSTLYNLWRCGLRLLRSVEHLFDLGLECRLITKSGVSRESCCKLGLSCNYRLRSGTKPLDFIPLHEEL